MPPGVDITIDSILIYAQNIGGFLYILGGILIAIAIIVSGIMYLKSAGNPQGIDSAKNMLKVGIIAALVIFGAGLIISTVRIFTQDPLRFFR